MLKETILSRSIRLICASGVVAGLGLLAPAAKAQEAAQEAPMQRVEVTGSSIKRLVSETANPLTVFKAEEFIKQGLTTAQEVLSKIPSNQSNLGSGNAVGGNTSGLPTGGQASADLRGLGGDKTLVLLNGRRIANHPYDGASVDLNIIPISALDQVEVLRDGASAIYGTDAIGGVINFITKRSINATNITAEVVAPEKKGGGERRLNLSTGYGNLDKDGFNLFGVIDYHKQGVLTSQERDFSKTGVIPSRGLNLTSGTTFPGNYYDATADKAGKPQLRQRLPAATVGAQHQQRYLPAGLHAPDRRFAEARTDRVLRQGRLQNQRRPPDHGRIPALGEQSAVAHGAAAADRPDFTGQQSLLPGQGGRRAGPTGPVRRSPVRQLASHRSGPAPDRFDRQGRPPGRRPGGSAGRLGL